VAVTPTTSFASIVSGQSVRCPDVVGTMLPWLTVNGAPALSDFVSTSLHKSFHKTPISLTSGTIPPK
jgi:hypothetical protein